MATVNELIVVAEQLTLQNVEAKFADLTKPEQKWLILYMLASQISYIELLPLLDRAKVC